MVCCRAFMSNAPPSVGAQEMLGWNNAIIQSGIGVPKTGTTRSGIWNWCIHAHLMGISIGLPEKLEFTNPLHQK